MINILCDHCLLNGYADRKRRIEAAAVDDAIEYLQEGERPAWTQQRALRLVPGAVALWAARGSVGVLIIVLVGLLMFAATAMGWLSPVPR